MSESPPGGDPSGSPSMDASQAFHQSQEAQAAAAIAQARPRPAPTMAYFWKEYNPNIKVLYIRNHDEANAELSKLGAGPQALGFDLEWKPNYVKGASENPVALVQLANGDTIFLLQISAMREFPSKLAEVLANPLIVKTGVAIQCDAKKLYNDCQKNMYNCVDMSLLARTVDNDQWKGKYNSSLGLARLVEFYEYRLLPKGKITRSNWEANLTPSQVEYACNDAHAGYILYRKLESMIPSLTNPPESIWYTFNFVSGYFLSTEGSHWQANNPNYDPGPPPPPRPPREPKQTDGAETQLQDKGEDVSPVAKNALNFRRTHGGQLGRGAFRTRKRQPDHSNVVPHDPGARGVGSGSQFRPHLPSGPNIHFQNRQQHRQHKNFPQRFPPPPLESSSQVSFQQPNGPNVHYQPTQRNGMPRHPHIPIPPMGSSSRALLQHPDGNDIHLPRRQQQNLPQYPHSLPPQTMNPPVPNGSFAHIPPPVSLIPHNAIPQTPSTSVYVNSLPPFPANGSRPNRRARQAHPNKTTSKP